MAFIKRVDLLWGVQIRSNGLPIQKLKSMGAFKINTYDVEPVNKHWVDIFLEEVGKGVGGAVYIRVRQSL